MDNLPWYQSAIVRQQIVAFVLAAFALFGKSLPFDVDATLAAIFGGIAALIPIWTIVTRLFKPTPPITETAKAKTQALVDDGKLPPVSKQGGFARVAVLGMLLALGVAAVTLPACTGTTAAYREAEGLSEQAYVLTEHYAAVVHEAADLATSGQLPENVKAQMKAADAVARKVFAGDPAANQPGLGEFAQAYQGIRDAKTTADLQAAIARASVALANLITAVKSARSA